MLYRQAEWNWLCGSRRQRLSCIKQAENEDGSQSVFIACRKPGSRVEGGRTAMTGNRAAPNREPHGRHRRITALFVQRARAEREATATTEGACNHRAIRTPCAQIMPKVRPALIGSMGGCITGEGIDSPDLKTVRFGRETLKLRWRPAYPAARMDCYLLGVRLFDFRK